MIQAAGNSVVPEWLQVVAAGAPLATLIAALIAAGIAVVTLIQRHRADKRDQWWKRAQWAMDLAINGELPAKLVGLKALSQLGQSKLLAREEEEFLFEVGAAAQDLVLDTIASESETKTRSLFRRRT